MLLGFVFDARDDLPPEAEAELRELQRKDRRARGARRHARVRVPRPGYPRPPEHAAAADRASLRASRSRASRLPPTTSGCGARATPARSTWRGCCPWRSSWWGSRRSLFGPFVMVPGTAAVTVASLLVNLRANPAARRATLLLGLAAVLVPMALQLSGLTPAVVRLRGQDRSASCPTSWTSGPCRRLPCSPSARCSR